MKLAKPRDPISNADALITIVGVDGYFTTISEGTYSATRPTYSDGLSAQLLHARTGRTSYSDITISRSFDPESEEDQALLAWLDEYRYGEPCEINVTYVRRQRGLELRGGKSSITYLGCRVQSYNFSALDTAGGDSVGMVSITFTVDDMRIGNVSQAG